MQQAPILAFCTLVMLQSWVFSSKYLKVANQYSDSIKLDPSHLKCIFWTGIVVIIIVSVVTISLTTHKLATCVGYST